MKKKVLALILMSVMAMSLITGCGSDKKEETDAKQSTAKEDTKKEDTKDGDYQFVSPEDAVKAAKEGKTHVLDVREWANYVAGRVADSQWCPIFPLEDDLLVEGMAAYAKESLSDGEDIYIICNSGQKGAQKATGALKDAGIDETKIYTVEGGAKALAEVDKALTTDRTEEQIDWQYVSGEEAVKAAGGDDIQILDVRDDDTYKAGHLKDSLQVNLKDTESAEAQTALYNLATEKMDLEKPVYLLCYSGNKCAKTGISVLKDVGFDTDNLFIIENGAKDSAVSGAFVTE